jgi:hypothetical protein
MKHQIETITFSGHLMKIRVGKCDYKVDLSALSKRLLEATKVQRMTYRVSPAGYGIHWPLIDEDLTVDGIIKAALPTGRLEKQAS